MVETLMYLATRCAFLFRPNWFRIVDSRVDSSFGGDAMVVLESTLTRLRFTYDRAQLLMEFQPIEGEKGRRREWFSNGLLRGALLGDRGESEVLNDEWASFLSWALEEFESKMSNPGDAEAITAALRTQAKLRAEELFG